MGHLIVLKQSLQPLSQNNTQTVLKAKNIISDPLLQIIFSLKGNPASVRKQ